MKIAAYRWGKVCVLNISDGAMSLTNSWQDVYTNIPNQYRPSVGIIYFSSYNSYAALAVSGSAIKARSANGSSQSASIIGCTTYITN